MASRCMAGVIESGNELGPTHEAFAAGLRCAVTKWPSLREIVYVCCDAHGPAAALWTTPRRVSQPQSAAQVEAGGPGGGGGRTRGLGGFLTGGGGLGGGGGQGTCRIGSSQTACFELARRSLTAVQWYRAVTSACWPPRRLHICCQLCRRRRQSEEAASRALSSWLLIRGCPWQWPSTRTLHSQLQGGIVWMLSRSERDYLSFWGTNAQALWRRPVCAAESQPRKVLVHAGDTVLMSSKASFLRSVTAVSHRHGHRWEGESMSSQ